MSKKMEPFSSKVWLSSPTMHGPELEYVKEAYETMPVKKSAVSMQWHYQPEQQHFIWR